MSLLGKILIDGNYLSQLPKSFVEKVADLLVASGKLCGNCVKQRPDVIFGDRHYPSDDPLQSRNFAGGKRPQENPRRIGREFRVGARDIDRDGADGAVIRRRRGCEHWLPVEICDVCDLPRAVLDVIDMYQC